MLPSGRRQHPLPKQRKPITLLSTRGRRPSIRKKLSTEPHAGRKYTQRRGGTTALTCNITTMRRQLWGSVVAQRRQTTSLPNSGGQLHYQASEEGVFNYTDTHGSIISTQRQYVGQSCCPTNTVCHYRPKNWYTTATRGLTHRLSTIRRTK